MSGLHGLLLLDKPGGSGRSGGPTSHDIVNRVRRSLGCRRVGHAGTLDPMASGLLPLVVGSATRLVRFLPSSPKHYEGTLLLGVRTASDDVTGEILERHRGPLPDLSRVVAAAERLTGHFEQRPPAVSARKVGGERLYRLARRGVRVEAPARPVEVERFDLEPAGEPGLYRFLAVVSGGTYIRSLARDLGTALGCGGSLASLRRTRIGPLDVADAVTMPAQDVPPGELLRSALRPPEAMPLELPTCTLGSPDEAGRFRSGSQIPTGLEDAGPFRVVDAGGRLLGVGEGRDGLLQPRIVLPGEGPDAG